jgi:diguanylate cyclase (GGDEF)-like protein
MVPDILPRPVVLAKLNEFLVGARGADRGVGVLIIHVGGLRRVNLCGGYAAGDRMLLDVRDRLQSVARRGDWIGRIGDEDFAFIAPNVSDEGQLLLGADKLKRALETLGALHGPGAMIVPSIGVAVFPKDGEDPERLLWTADLAIGMTERQGTLVPVSGNALDEAPKNQWQLETLLARAVDRGEIELHYQPKFNLRDGSYAGVEALARWTSAELGDVSPGVFIPIAEASGAIENLTWSCVHSALQQVAEWRSQGFQSSVAVNISVTCLRAVEFSERIRGALGLWNVNPSSLTLEITESAVMENPERSFGVLRDLRQFGVRISIDDFGTGHSSFAYFRGLPADELKIDRSFVASLSKSTADGHIVRSIIDLAHKFDFTVVAEGIEEEQSATILRDMQCDVAQGYHLSRPMTADKIPGLSNTGMKLLAPYLRRA